jgi:hypothetical protein
MPDSFKIDAHVHVFTSDMPLVDNPRHAPKYSFTHEQLIATLDENGIDRAVIAAASPWGDYNDYILAALRAHPARLRGTAIFNRPVERLVLEAMSRDGFVGVRLPFIGLPKLPDITTFDYRALFRRLADLDWHVHPHVEGDDLPKILPTLEDCGVKIVVDHLGRPNLKSGVNTKVSRPCCARSTKAAPGSSYPAATGLARRQRTLHANFSASPAPTGWYGRATARSSGTRASFHIGPPSTGWLMPFPTPPRARKFLARPRANSTSTASDLSLQANAVAAAFASGTTSWS